jgi:hypothetical protein
VVCNSSTISPRCFGQLKYKEAAFQRFSFSLLEISYSIIPIRSALPGYPVFHSSPLVSLSVVYKFILIYILYSIFICILSRYGEWLVVEWSVRPSGSGSTAHI